MNSGQTPAYQAGMDARFAAAARHSRFVRLLRVAVPAAVILSMGMIVAVSIFNPFRMILNKLPMDMGNLVVSGTKITMEQPHLSGFSPDGRPYELWAKTATQDVTDPTHVELGSLRAKVRMEDQSSVTMDARTGLFDTKAQLLELHKDIFLQSSTGYEARMTQALVDIAQGTVTSDEQVDVKLLNGTLVGQRLKIIDHGALVRFEGGVVMNLVMDQPDPAATAPGEAAAEPVPAADPAPKTRTPSGKSGNAK